jgi:hypothetical protein
MNQIETAPKSASLLSALDSLLAACDAFRNFRAILLMAMTFIVAVLVGGVLTFLASKTELAILGLLGMLLVLVILFYGANAVGILLMHDVQDQAQHDVMAAMMQSLGTGHHLIGVAILAFLAMVAAYLLVALLLLFCKIPFMGPVIFTLVFPLSAVFLGVLTFALFYVMMPLAGPAVWSGSSMFEAITSLMTIARTRIISIVTHQIVLFVIVMFVAGIIFGVMALGMLGTFGLAGRILGFGGMNFFSGLSGEIDGYQVAGGIGGGLLYAVAAVIPALVAIKGSCIIYLNAIQGLDFGQAEQQLKSGLAAARKKAEEARERARQTVVQREKAAMASAPPVATPPAAPPSAPVETGPAAQDERTVIFARSAPAAPQNTVTKGVPPLPVIDVGIVEQVDAPKPVVQQLAPDVPAQASARGSIPVQAPESAPTLSPAPACPSCHVPIGVGDVFCGNCGHKLK